MVRSSERSANGPAGGCNGDMANVSSHGGQPSACSLSPTLSTDLLPASTLTQLQAAAMRNSHGQLPLDALLVNAAQHTDRGAVLATARTLLAAPGQSATALLQSLALARGSSLAQQLYAEVVATHACHLGQWHLVPLSCPGLAAVLPTVLSRSEWEAAQLARRLPAAEAQRLQVAALALNRAQARTGLPLPQPLVGRILALACAGEASSC